MSGIAGVVDFSGRPVERAHLEMMTGKLAHRGPDGIHHWLEGNVGLGHCMLHTTPESLTEQQPLVNSASHCTLVMDGRIDNWEELRLEFKRPQANDAELVMLAYEAWGDEFPSRLDGDFAIALWDQRRNVLHCCRDVFGIRPFYYHWDGQRFSFASELGPLCALPWVTTTLNEGVVAEYVGFEWHSLEETFWLELKKLPPRHRMTIESAGLCTSCYWEPEFFTPLTYKTDAEYAEHYRELMIENVRRISRSHLPIAFEVSGGLDSSAVYSMANSLHFQGRLLAPKMRGYTLGFPQGTRAYELDYAQAVAEFTGTIIEECEPTLRPLSWYRAMAVAWRNFPGVPNGIMGIGIRESAKSQGARVLVTGIGGDEWTGNFNNGLYYADFISTRDWTGLTQALVQDMHTLGHFRAAWWVLKYGVIHQLPPTLLAVLRRVTGRASARQGEWLTPQMRGKLQKQRQKSLKKAVNRPFFRPSQRHLMQALDDPYSVIANELSDQLDATLEIEVRTPYRNKKVVQFAFSTSEWMRQRGIRHRWLHREAMADLLPKSVLNRLSKAEFSIVFEETNKETSSPEFDAILARRSDWITSEIQITSNINRDKTKKPDIYEQIKWYLICCNNLKDIDSK